jgi:HEAT repeat protein
MRRVAAICMFILAVSTALTARTVNNPLAKSLEKVFPEIGKGFIDLNGNKTLDENGDINERIGETTIKDDQTQIKEVLEFILTNFRMIPIEKLKQVRDLLEKPTGTIQELISLQYLTRIEKIIVEKEELDARGLYLTPREREEALSKISGLIGTMIKAYKTEDKAAETDFEKARDEFFTMIEQGYPFPEYIGEEDKAILATIMIHSANSFKSSNRDRARFAIKSLGRMKSDMSTPWLLKYMNDPNLKLATIQALGDIGNSEALGYLLSEMDTVSETETKVEIIRAIGKIGDSNVLNRLVTLLKPADGSQPDTSLVVAVLKSMVIILEKITPPRELYEVFMEYSRSQSPEIRKMAIGGLKFYPTRQTTEFLMTLLGQETLISVKTTIITVLNNFIDKTVIIAFRNILISKNSTIEERVAVIDALGENKLGMTALIEITNSLNTSDPRLRNSAQRALIRIYSLYPRETINTINGVIARSTEKNLLINGTRVLAEISDEISLPMLVPHLTSPYSEVKENVTWALYRIKKPDPRALDELNKIVKSESETLNVRINAVRALGAIRVDLPNLKIWSTLLNVAKMRGSKYMMLRKYAIDALGNLGSTEPEVITTMLKIAGKTDTPIISMAALNALKRIVRDAETAEESLITAFRRESNEEMRTRIIETLGDIGSSRTVDMGIDLLKEDTAIETRMRIIYSLSRLGGEAEVRAILDAARDKELVEYVIGVLEDQEPTLMTNVIRARLQSESDPNVQEVLNTLKDHFDEQL